MTLRALADSVVADGGVLAYIPSPSQGVWHIGPFPLRAYALCIIIGIVVAIWWGERRWQARGGQSGTVLDVAMFAVPFGLVGGRLYHVATDYQKYFGPNGHAIDALKIYQGGLGIWGAVFLGGIGAWIGCRVYRIPLPAFGDAIAPPILLAQAIGRLGNYFNQELYGRETELPWGLEIYLRFDDDGKLDMMNGVSTGVVEKVVEPTFLYELVWNLIIVALLVQIDRRFRIGHGRLFALYVAGYCAGRFVVELLRDDEATKIAGIRINSFTSALVFLLAIAYVIFATKGREAPETLQPGVAKRPWPWQFGRLRVAAAESEAAAAAVALEKAAAAEKSDTAAADDESGDAESEDAAESAKDEKSGATGKSGGAKDGADDAEPENAAAEAAVTTEKSGVSTEKSGAAAESAEDASSDAGKSTDTTGSATAEVAQTSESAGGSDAESTATEPAAEPSESDATGTATEDSGTETTGAETTGSAAAPANGTAKSATAKPSTDKAATSTAEGSAAGTNTPADKS